MLAGAGHGGVEGNPVAAELLLAIRNWRLPVERLSRLIEEHQFDLYNDPMPTMAALEGYINDTSSALFSLGGRIAGGIRRDRAPRAPRRPCARHRAGAGGAAARCVAASVVRAAAIAGKPWQRAARIVRAARQTAELRAALAQCVGEAREHLKTALSAASNAPPGDGRFPAAALVPRSARMSRAAAIRSARSTVELRTLSDLWRASQWRLMARRARSSRSGICSVSCSAAAATRSCRRSIDRDRPARVR